MSEEETKPQKSEEKSEPKKSKKELEKIKELKSRIDKLKRKYGAGVVMNLDDSKASGVEFGKSGIYALDDILGGGIPRGRIVELYGMESSGKSTLAIHIAKTFQQRGEKVAILDTENAFDAEYAKKIGVDLNDLLFSQPDWGEQALDVIDGLIKGGVKLIIVDSVAGLVPKAELDGDAGMSLPGKVARLMSQAIRRLGGPVRKEDCCLIFINQIRQKIGIIWGSPNVTPGGLALKFGASVRLEIRRKAKLKTTSDEFVGIKVAAKTVKNKVYSPFRECDFDIIFEVGISVASDILEIGLKKKIIKKKGISFYFNEEIIGASKPMALDELASNKELRNNIEEELNKL